MSLAHLRPCSGCARHVRANVTKCPFCDAQLAIDTVAPAQPQERLGRAARMAFGGAAAAVVLTVAACGKKESIAMPYGAPPDRGTPDAGNSTPTDPTGTAIAQPYGAPPDPSTPIVATVDAGSDAGKKTTTTPKATTAPTPTKPANINKPYGAPPADGYDVFEV